MKNIVGGKGGGFLMMVLSILGVVLYVTLFSNILTGFVSLESVTNAASYTAYSTVVKIAPTILFLVGIFGAGLLYYKGYKTASNSGVNGMMMVVFGALELILFTALFVTIMSAMETLRTNANVGDFTALSTVIQIAPAVLLLGGLFAGGMSVVSGAKKIKKGRKSSMV